MLVKEMSLCISVMGPPPPRVARSCLSVVYPGNLGVLLGCLSLVSWIVAMCMLCLSRCSLSCARLLSIPSMLNCKMFSVVLGRRGVVSCCGGGAGGGGVGGRGGDRSGAGPGTGSEGRGGVRGGMRTMGFGVG